MAHRASLSRVVPPGASSRAHRVAPTGASGAVRLSNRAVGRALADAAGRLPADTGDGRLSGELAARIHAQRGGGVPLPDDLRESMQHHLGTDLGGVRVHTGDAAADLSRSLAAAAFTSGRDVFFGAGRYAPRSAPGRELIAHEMVHVAQGSATRPAPDRQVSDPGDASEVEARALAPAVARTVAPARTAQAATHPVPDGPQDAAGRTVGEGAAVARAVHRQHVPAAPGAAPGGTVTGTEGTVAGPPTAAAASAEVARRLAYQATVLRHTPELVEEDRRALAGVIAGFPVYELVQQRSARRDELTAVQQSLTDYRARNDALARGEELSGGVGASAALLHDLETRGTDLTREIGELTGRIEPLLTELGTDEAGLTRRVTEEFPRLWLARAAQVVGQMLTENEQVARTERDRYRSDVCSQDTHGLLDVDARLVAAAHERADLERRRDELDALVRSSSEPLPGGVRDTPDSSEADRQAIARLDDQIRENVERSRAERDAHGLAYPILLHASYRPGAFQHLPEGRLELLLGTWTDTVLEDIAATRTNVADGTLKVWDLRDVPELTWASLGLSAAGPLGRVIESHRARERSREEAVETAMAALAVTAGIVATVATMGGAAVVAAAASGAAVGMGIVQLGRDVGRYSAESAASGVSVDATLADISRNEPDLLPVVMDVVGIGFDAAAAVSVARAAVQAERTLLAAGRAAEYAAAIERIIPDADAAARVMRRAAQSVEVMEGVGTAAAVVGSSARSAGSVRLAELALQLSAEESVFAELAAQMASRNRVTLATEQAIRARFTNPQELTRALDGLNDLGGIADGWYDPTLRHLFVRSADAHTMASTLVHEAVHAVQHGAGQPLISFLAEFQAVAAQRDYLLSVMRVSGRGAIPPAFLEYVDNDLPTIAARLSARYSAAFPQYAAAYAIPAGFNAEISVHEMARMVTAAMRP